MTAVVLVDGIGRPKLHLIPDALIPPTIIRWPHALRASDGKQVLAEFVRTDECSPDEGLAIYRQRGYGDPAIRWAPAYLRRQSIGVDEPPKLRLEGATGD